MVTQRPNALLMLVSLLSVIGGMTLTPANARGFWYPLDATVDPNLTVHDASLNMPLGFDNSPLKNLESDPDEDESSNPHQRPARILLEMNGILELGDRIAYQDGSLYDEYEIDGQQGQQVHIRLESLEFDPYLVIIHPNGDILAQNDDVTADNLNSFLDLKLPVNGTYRVVANGFDRHSRGEYRLTVSTLNLEQFRDDDEAIVDNQRQ